MSIPVYDSYVNSGCMMQLKNADGDIMCTMDLTHAELHEVINARQMTPAGSVVIKNMTQQVILRPADLTQLSLTAASIQGFIEACIGDGLTADWLNDPRSKDVAAITAGAVAWSLSEGAILNLDADLSEDTTVTITDDRDGDGGIDSALINLSQDGTGGWTISIAGITVLNSSELANIHADANKQSSIAMVRHQDGWFVSTSKAD